jgi:DNA invertase Pin-like site-specific DNA recombinase
MEAIKPIPKIWTLQEVQLLEKWQHLSTHIIAKRLNRSRKSVTLKRHKMGLSRYKKRGKHSPIDPEKKAVIIQLHSEGLPQTEKAHRVGCSQWTVSKTLRTA